MNLRALSVLVELGNTQLTVTAVPLVSSARLREIPSWVVLVVLV